MRVPSGLSRAACVIVSSWATVAAPGLQAAPPEEADVVLRIAPASGEPGEEVAIEFRATVKVPLVNVSVQFDLSRDAAEFIRTSVEGTAASDVVPRAVIYDPRFRGGYRAGVQRCQIEPGEDLILFKTVFRIDANAAHGIYPVKVLSTDFTAVPSVTAGVRVEGDGVFTVEPPGGPRPVGELGCRQSGTDVALSWTLTEAYDAVAVRRNGALVATLGGMASDFHDAPAPGPASYEVAASGGGAESLPARCELLVQVARPDPVTDLTCAPAAGVVALAWTNGAAYDAIQVLRNGLLLAELAGAAQSHSDVFESDLFTVYSVRARAGGVETLPATCKLNELSDQYVMWAEDVRAEPGDTGVQVRLFLTNPKVLQGIQVGLRIDPALVRMRELSIDGTAADAAQADFFAYQRFYVPGETVVGIVFDDVPPYGFLFPAGADQHFLTVIADVLPGTESGTRVPVEFGVFGSPPNGPILTVVGQDQACESHDGSISIGSSPVPEIEGARAEVDTPAAPKAVAPAVPASSSIRLSWTNAADYTAIRIERDGGLLAEIVGDRTSHADADPGPGIHRYRIVAKQGAFESFPTVVAAYPSGVPGTFLRGDANADGAIRLTDAVVVILYLFRGRAEPDCLDAADADDSGHVNLTDVVGILSHLFLEAGPLPLPGSRGAWFDPTADELPCGSK